MVRSVALLEEAFHVEIAAGDLVHGNLDHVLAVRPDLEDLARRHDVTTSGSGGYFHSTDFRDLPQLRLHGLALAEVDHFDRHFGPGVHLADRADELLALRDLLALKRDDQIVAFQSGLVRRAAFHDIVDANALARIEPQMLREQFRQRLLIQAHPDIRPRLAGQRHRPEQQQGRTTPKNHFFSHDRFSFPRICMLITSIAVDSRFDHSFAVSPQSATGCRPGRYRRTSSLRG